MIHQHEREAAVRGWRLNLALVPALVMAVLPKCPFCLLAYAGVLGTLGFDPVLYRSWLLPLTAIFSGTAVGMLAYRARRRRGYGPFFLGLLAVSIILTGKFHFDYMPATYLGVGLLLSASVWNSWPKRDVPESARCHC
ncbi:MAG: hypothetical protein WCF57_16295 [Pyrinomonadaceae bacterium]